MPKKFGVLAEDVLKVVLIFVWHYVCFFFFSQVVLSSPYHTFFILFVASTFFFLDSIDTLIRPGSMTNM